MTDKANREDMWVQSVEYFEAQMDKMSDKGLKTFLREVSLEVIRRKIRVLPHNDLVDVLISARMKMAKRKSTTPSQTASLKDIDLSDLDIQD